MSHAPTTFSTTCRVIALPAAALMLLVLAACGSDDSEDQAAGSGGVELAGTSWTLTSVLIDGSDTAAVAVATLDFAADGTVAGSTGCNQFAGSYEQTDAELTIELGPVTLAACSDAAVTAQEAGILAQLPEVASFTSEAAALVLMDAEGTAVLTYEAGLASLEGTAWTATGINNGQEAVESTELTQTVTAQFGSDGALSGVSGCNNYNATYEVSGEDAISISAIATTRKACEEPAMTLETQYLAALEQAATYTLSGNSLTLRDSSGSTMVTYTLSS